MSSLQRRDFLKAGAAVAAFHILPSGARAVSPNSKLRTAHIGVGGMGKADLERVSSHSKVEVAALCDVDQKRLDAASSRHAGAKTFRDYREMLSELGDTVDAVVVSTPDHTHAPAALTAMNLGKPVYCQKPLTHAVYEARQMRLTSGEKGLVTQMGIQAHSGAVYRRAVKIIQSGVIGKVSRVLAWSFKNWGYDGGRPQTETTPPDYLDWNLWIGTARMRKYAPKIYHPSNWRKMVDFGTGTLGDMGVHIFDTPYTALELTAPNWVKTTCRQPTGVGHPEKNTVEYEFPGTEYTTDTLMWKWYDGAFAPPQAEDAGLPKGTELPKQGSLFIGQEGSMLLPHIKEAQLFPLEKFNEYNRPEVEDGNHYHQWVEACLGNDNTSAGFDYAGRLTEALLLGVVANRFPEAKLKWNAKELRFTNVSAANQLLRPDYRDGFEVVSL